MSQSSVKNKRLLWIVASLSSLALLSFVIAQVDINQVYTMLQNTSWGLLGVAFFCLFAEGIITSLRLWWFASRKPSIGAALKANAWYVLFLVILPARLGEVAAIVVLERNLGQKYGAATMSIIAQRLYDVVILSVFFLIAIIGAGGFIETQTMIILAVFLIGFSLFVLIRLDMFLTILALFIKQHSDNNQGLLKKLFKLALQARTYTRHNLRHQGRGVALVLTVGKWLGNLGALVFLFMAINLNIPIFESATVAALYNFLAIIPLQTVGGIGVGEAGLTLLLTSIGVTMTIAAGSSLMIRFVILVFPFIFWVTVMGVLRIKHGSKNDKC